jgi:hypothetical protein
MYFTAYSLKFFDITALFKDCINLHTIQGEFDSKALVKLPLIMWFSRYLLEVIYHQNTVCLTLNEKTRSIVSVSCMHIHVVYLDSNFTPSYSVFQNNIETCLTNHKVNTKVIYDVLNLYEWESLLWVECCHGGRAQYPSDPDHYAG